MKSVSIGLFLGVFVLVAACNKSSFSGSTAPAPVISASPAAPIPIQADAVVTSPAPTTVASSPAPCQLNGDMIQLDFPPEVKTCMQGGHMWDFNNSKCSTVAQASSYQCSFDGINQALQAKFGSLDPIGNIQKYKNQGAKIVGCGEKNNLVVAQYYIPPTGNQIDCTFTPQTGQTLILDCYESVSDPNEPNGSMHTTTDPAQMTSCLN